MPVVLRVLPWLACLVLLSGCQFFARPPLLAGQVHLPAGTQAATAVRPLPPERGLLVLLIHWPERDYPGFRAALIPTSTNAIALTLKTASGSVIVEKTVPRQADDASVSVELEVDAASSISVLPRAHREAAPDLATAPPIAQGTAAGVNILPAKVTRLASPRRRSSSRRSAACRKTPGPSATR